MIDSNSETYVAIVFCRFASETTEMRVNCASPAISLKCTPGNLLSELVDIVENSRGTYGFKRSAPEVKFHQYYINKENVLVVDIDN